MGASERPSCGTCGGRGGHVPWCPELRKEEIAREDASARFQRRWREHQRLRLAAVTGAVVTGIDLGNGHGRNVVTFSGGYRLVIRLTGREMDGHGECSDQSMVAEVETAEEFTAEGAWHAFYERDCKEHPEDHPGLTLVAT